MIHDLKTFSRYSPVLAPSSNNESEEAFDLRWEKFDKLSEEIKDKISSDYTIETIEKLSISFNINMEAISCVSRAIRNYYFGELKLEDFSFVLSKEMNIDLATAQKIFQIVKEQIINDQSYERALQATLTSLPLSEALRIYPETGEQLVTSNKINLRNFPYPVRPSIKNWLADYTSILGYEKHEAMARSQYLFQGANTKNLSAPEKNKLAYLLKSFDENSPITLNKNTKQVIWPASNATSVAPAGWPANENRLPKNLTDQFRPIATPQTEQKNINSLEFSYRQKLPYEKNLPREIPTESQGAERILQGKPQNFSTKPITPQNLPKNVVDLKNSQQ